MKELFKKIVIKVITWEARVILARRKPKIVAVTGSVGKTSTKDAIFTALRESRPVRKSRGSYNSEFGVPLTIIGESSGYSSFFSWLGILIRGFLKAVFVSKYPEVLILEVGAGKPGDIAWITSWLKPDVAVVTGLGTTPVHVEFFDSAEQVAEEKANFVKAIGRYGVAVLNNDDQKAVKMKQMAPSGHVFTYGFANTSKFKAEDYHIVYEDEKPIGLKFRVDNEGKSVPVFLTGVVGKSHVYAVLAALAVGSVLKANIVDMIDAFNTHDITPGRMRLLSGVKNSSIIDDTYNSSPAAAKLALETLDEIESEGKKIAVLGDMMELGEHTKPEHEALGLQAVEICDELITVGSRARFSAEIAISSGLGEDRVASFDDVAESAKYLEHLINQGDVVLIKGSQSARLEKVASEVIAEPERAGELLVRQGPEWD